MAYNQPYYGGGYFMPYQQNGAMQGVLEQYKGQYQPPMQQTPIQPVTQIKPTSDIIWVQGEAGAKGYLVAPNNTVVLWDTETPTIYVKTADASGLPTMRVLDFKERNGDAQNNGENAPATHKCTCGDKFITKEEFNALKGKFYDLQAKYDKLMLEQEEKTSEKSKTTGKKTKESEE